MNQLVSLSKKVLFNKNNVGFRLPKQFGIFVGYIFDFIFYIKKTTSYALV